MTGEQVIVMALLFGAAYLMQFFLAYLQSKKIASTWARLARERAGNGYIGMNRRRRFGVAPVVIMVSDSSLRLSSAWVLQGLLNTSRMHELVWRTDFDIQSIAEGGEELKDAYGSRQAAALVDAARNILDSAERKGTRWTQ